MHNCENYSLLYIHMNIAFVWIVILFSLHLNSPVFSALLLLFISTLWNKIVRFSTVFFRFSICLDTGFAISAWNIPPLFFQNFRMNIWSKTWKCEWREPWFGFAAKNKFTNILWKGTRKLVRIVFDILSYI